VSAPAVPQLDRYRDSIRAAEAAEERYREARAWALAEAESWLMPADAEESVMRYRVERVRDALRRARAARAEWSAAVDAMRAASAALHADRGGQ